MTNKLADRLEAMQVIFKHIGNTEFTRTIDEAIAALRSEPMVWMPIETAPKDGQTILLLVPTLYAKWNDSLALSGRWQDVFWLIFNADEAVQRVEPTHWMPLPAAPSREQDQRGGKSGETPDLEGLKVQSTPHLTASPARLSAEQVENARHELHEGITVSSWVIDRLCDAALSSLTARSDGIEAAANVCRKELDDCPSTPRLFDRGYACACENLMERISALKEGK